jgi:AraC-like DNA-binding protein
MRLSQSDLEIIQQVRCFLEKEYKYQHTQAQLARRFHVNESKLRKGFVAVYQTAIYEYQVNIRIERAKELLADTDEPVKAIAYRVGYNIKSLEKQFKSITGMSPLEWRKTYSSAYIRKIVA